MRIVEGLRVRKNNIFKPIPDSMYTSTYSYDLQSVFPIVNGHRSLAANILGNILLHYHRTPKYACSDGALKKPHNDHNSSTYIYIHIYMYKCEHQLFFRVFGIFNPRSLIASPEPITTLEDVRGSYCKGICGLSRSAHAHNLVPRGTLKQQKQRA